jgi:hypothetical protein
MRKASSLFLVLAIFFFPQISAALVKAPSIDAASIFELTNEARGENGRPPLLWDARLSEIAEEKLDDMFEREYFAHKDPDGKTAGARALADGYQFTLLGENLAMGWYESPDALVDAWMGSSGHRKNILLTGFTSIGVAFGLRQFKGEETMIAIQIFAHPLVVGPEPSSELARAIVVRQTYAKKLGELMNAYIEEAGGGSNRSVRILTNQVSAVMAIFLRELDDKIRAYDAQVKEYEHCGRA